MLHHKQSGKDFFSVIQRVFLRSLMIVSSRCTVIAVDEPYCWEGLQELLCGCTTASHLAACSQSRVCRAASGTVWW